MSLRHPPRTSCPSNSSPACVSYSSSRRCTRRAAICVSADSSPWLGLLSLRARERGGGGCLLGSPPCGQRASMPMSEAKPACSLAPPAHQCCTEVMASGMLVGLGQQGGTRGENNEAAHLPHCYRLANLRGQFSAGHGGSRLTCQTPRPPGASASWRRSPRLSGRCGAAAPGTRHGSRSAWGGTRKGSATDPAFSAGLPGSGSAGQRASGSRAGLGAAGPMQQAPCSRGASACASPKLAESVSACGAAAAARQPQCSTDLLPHSPLLQPFVDAALVAGKL